MGRRLAGHRLVLHYLIYPVIIVVTFLLVTLINTRVLRDAIYEAHTQDLGVTARVIGNAIAPEMFADRESAEAAIRTVADSVAIRVTLIAADGTVLADTHGSVNEMDNHGDRPEVRQALAGEPAPVTRASTTLGEDLIYIAIPVYRSEPDGQRGEPVGVVRSAMIVEDVRSRLAVLFRQIVVPGMVMLMVALFAAFSLSRSIRVPLRHLHRAATAYAAGDLDYALPAEGAQELVELGRTFRSMARDLKRRLEEIEYQRRETEEVLDTIREPLFVIDDHTRIQRLNIAAARFVSVDPHEATGRLFSDLFRNSMMADFLSRVRESDTIVESVIESVGRTETHLAVWGVRLSSRGSVLRDQSLIVLRDVTREYRLDRIRRDFVSNVSHEIKTPLTMIQGAAETLAEIPDSDDAARRTFEKMITTHAERMGRIVEDLLSLARLEQEDSNVERQPADIAEIARESVAIAQGTHGRSVSLSVTEGLIWPVERVLLSLALTNLIDNALRYGGPEGPVSVSVALVADRLTITVTDVGPGIPPTETERVFERFYRVDRGRSRESGGTGLGLAIVRHAVRSQGGQVALQSVVGKGSSFTITIPSIQNIPVRGGNT